MPSGIVERPIILCCIIPDWPTYIRECLDLSSRKRPTDRVMLIPCDTTHLPVRQTDRALAAILKRDRLIDTADVYDFDRIVRRTILIRIGLAVVV